MAKRGESAPGAFEGLIRGDQALARFIFHDARKRRLVKQLQQEGWPIFDLAGKRCAFPADLGAAMRKAVSQARPPSRRHRQRGASAEAATP
jgi:hypothetical protein